MRILVLDEEFPWPLNTGKRIRSYNLTRELAKYHEITYLAYAEPESTAERHFTEIGLNPITVPLLDRAARGPIFYWRLVANLLSSYPYIVTSHYTPRYKHALQKLLALKQFDMIICEWTPYALYVKDIRGPRKVIVAHNIESAIWRRYEQNETNSVRRWYISIQRKKVEEFERTCFGWVDGATAVSAQEAQTIAGFGIRYPVEVIDNGVDTEYFAPQPASDKALSLVFTGSMDWRPNQDAARYFVSDIWPMVRQKYPDARVYWVGRDPSPDVLDLQKQPGVVITGTVDDVRPFIASGSVYIVPLRIGGGSRLKILEAMAMKKAVVSTTVGAEGLRVVDGRHLLIADSPADFAQAIERCINDESLSRRLGEQGRILVEEQYRWDHLGKRFHAYLQTLTSLKGAR
jgi:sugar transferase (PEP-CTERM/EpsH1 system associated)